MTESTPTEWTDEKHSLYLKSMEATFVNQLYNSIDDLDLQLKKETSDLNLSGQVHSSVCTPSGQVRIIDLLIVHAHGCINEASVLSYFILILF